MLSLRQIEILRTVILRGTTAGAARSLGMSQPAISNAIRKMETSLEIQLFERSNNRIYPLDSAKILLEDSEPIFSTLQALEERIDDLRTDKLSRLRILSTGPLGLGLLPEVLKKFATSHPGMTYRYDIRRLSQVVRGVETGQVDIGFGLELRAGPGLVTQKLAVEEMVCICRPDHPLASRGAITSDDLRGEPFIALDGRTTLGEVTRDGFRKAGVPFEFAIEVSNAATACAMVRAGLGSALVDPWTARQMNDGKLCVRRFTPRIDCAAYAFWSGRRSMSRVCSQFLSAVRRRIAADAPG
ncbi:LysR family transcriptional regulator [Salipiger sp.]|uniref:LysR family transcriptional regulator n=1 Tax=Salipiger sp. TaxID=2078585 RepID=UPI003A97E5D9